MKFARVFVLGFIDAWNAYKPDRMAAALAFFSMFSFVPLLFIALAIATFFLNDALVLTQIFSQIEQTFGPETSAFVQELLEIILRRNQDQSVWLTIISLVVLLWVASGLFAALEDMLNTLWGNPFPAQGGIFAMARFRLISFLLVIGTGFLLVAITTATFFAQALAPFFPVLLGSALTNVLLLFGFVMLAFALVYYVLARVKPKGRFIWLGAVVAALLLMLGRWAFSLYLSFSNVSTAFAAASTLAVLLLGIYYAALIFLVGAMLIRIVPEALAKAKGQTELTETR